MFRPADLIIDAFTQRLLENYDRAFPSGNAQHREALAQVARMALSRMTLTNALYTNMETVTNTTQIAEDVLQGRAIAQGDVTSLDWLQLLSASLCFVIGFVRGSVPGDDGRLCVIDEKGNTMQLDKNLTDGALWKHGTTRSMLFARHHFRQHPLIDGQLVASCIENTYFPFPPRKRYDNDSWPGLLRAAQTIAVVAEPRFKVRLKFLGRQLQEAGVLGDAGIMKPEDFGTNFHHTFWQTLFPQIGQAVHYLKYTSDGLQWLAAMNSHMLEEEHRGTDRPA